MPEIVGKFSIVGTSLSPTAAHVEHLSHLVNLKVARDVLSENHGMTVSEAKATAPLLAAHVRQALDFHQESVSSTRSTRPVLQYYCYLNLAVAAILAYRPANHSQYRQHGVEDRSYALKSLDLGSTLLRVKRGAVPLFHSIISDLDLDGRSFRLGQLLSGFWMVSSELVNYHNKTVEMISVHDKTGQDSGKWVAEFWFTCFRNGQTQKLTQNRLENAIPTLGGEYRYNRMNDDTLVYRSETQWTTKEKAIAHQRKHGLKLINFGGHQLTDFAQTNGSHRVGYFWRGVVRYKYLPTLTCVLLTSFAFASISRYRPLLEDSINNSPMQLLHSVFLQEADCVFIPAIRNLLYREETFVTTTKYV